MLDSSEFIATQLQMRWQCGPFSHAEN